MLSATRCQMIASQIRTTQNEARQVEPFTLRTPELDLPAVYAVADLIHESLMSKAAPKTGIQ